MPVIDMSTLEPVGEFGSKAWGDACAEASIKILIYLQPLPGLFRKITPTHLPDYWKAVVKKRVTTSWLRKVKSQPVTVFQTKF